MTMEDQDATATEMLNGDQMKSVRNLGNDLNFAAAKVSCDIVVIIKRLFQYHV